MPRRPPSTTARLIFVNASTVNTNRLLLHSIPARFLAGLGNDSGTLEKYVMDRNYRVSGVGYRAADHAFTELKKRNR